MVFDDPSYDPIGYLLMTAPAQIHLDALALEKLDPPKPDLTRFKRRGGELILYHGWTDPSLAPKHTIRYFDDIEEHTAGRRDAFARLFMIPGMAHCEFGPGAQIFDGIGAIRRWVEQGRKPDALLAVDLTGTLSRPLCKYPTEPVYLGGDPAKASSYDCR
ncbi:MAG TPA: tannase/feruloyl esterase family alpha/beta hydrolase [Vicinamibacteria bacterium]|nr:tannase/feruloyl esterase family alpha/beta hydrolase [Vicinamibacteria bacterium]